MLVPHVEVVDRQIQAYNAHDIDTFVACYTDDVQVIDPNGSVLARGLGHLRDRYASRFAAFPMLRAEIVHRSVGPPYVTDIERIAGWSSESIWATVIYRLTGDLIGAVVIATSLSPGPMG